ncbi:MAG TPA: Sec-independent protein translocase subunit TatB [Nitratifractor salsuginis]|uniref:Sec-independent protein translocase protein TatB homolog n=1 Tax=Nitratifractor salsuginis TaxID=269261 RepID=A0A7V2SJ61_9BACT|nr:Sec-independent protein translocase subunit TatB [Nitratifractor salsuginis]
MFGMGFSEILMIAVVAILFLGPDKLPDAMVQIAKFINSFRKTINEARSTFEEELHLKELKEEAMSYRRSLEESTSDISGFKHAVPNPAQELEEALQIARSGMPADRLNSEVDLLEEEDEVTETRPAVTEYKAMARKALAEADREEETSAPEASEGIESAAEPAPRPRSFKNLDNGSES